MKNENLLYSSTSFLKKDYRQKYIYINVCQSLQINLTVNLKILMAKLFIVHELGQVGSGGQFICK